MIQTLLTRYPFTTRSAEHRQETFEQAPVANEVGSWTVRKPHDAPRKIGRSEWKCHEKKAAPAATIENLMFELR